MTLLLSVAVLGVTLGLAYRLGVFSATEDPGAEPWTIAVSSKRLDFGRVPINGSVVRQLVVRNDGPQPVRANILVDGKSYRVSPDSLILHPGISSRISIVVEAAAPGSLSDSLRIQLDDDPSSLVIALDGEATDELAPQAAPGRAPLHVEVEAGAGADAERGSFGGVRAGLTRRGADEPGRVSPEYVADASAGARAGDTDSVSSRTLVTVPNGAGTQDASTEATAIDPDEPQPPAHERTSLGMNVVPYDPATAMPFRSLAERTVPLDAEIGEGEAAGAGELPSQIPGAGEDGLPTTLPEDLGGDDGDLFDDDDDKKPSKNPSDEPDPFDSPALRISGMSTVRLLGAVATFYPQELPVLGSDAGGAFSLASSLEFPHVPLAFGESMVFSQAGNPSGGFDAMTGEVLLQLPIHAIDSDGDAAPIVLHFTTSTVLARNESGVVVSLSGTPRVSDSGMLRLVAIEKIPPGFRNGAEQRLVVFEILASLTFSSIADSRSGLDGLRRIGG